MPVTTVWSDVVAQQILDFVNYGIAIIIILLVWEIFQVIRKGIGGSASAAGSRLVNWEKSPVLTKLGLNKKGKKQKTRQSKRAFKSALAEFVAEKAEYQILEKVKADLKALFQKKTELGAISSTDPNPKKEFEDFRKAVSKTFKDLKDETQGWKNVSRKTFRHQRELNRFIEEQEKYSKVDEAKLNQLRVAEREILVLHQNAANYHAALISSMKQLKEAAERAVNKTTTTRGPPPPTGYGGATAGPHAFDLVEAQADIKGINHVEIMKHIGDMIDIEGTGTASKAGVLKWLADITAILESM